MDTNLYLVAQYVLYLAASGAVTWSVGRTLHKNGAVFLLDTFRGKETLAAAVNHLLVVGFYLINFGWVVRGLKSGAPAESVQQVIENIASQLGTVLLVLGVMHFANVFVFNRIRTRAERRDPRDLPPVRPSEFLTPRMPAAPVQG